MANKHEVLKLAEKGLTDSQIAERLGCGREYVYATRRRATPEGRRKAAEWDRAQRARRQKT